MRFGQWRGMNGNNYYLTLQEIVSAEKKIRLLHLLKYKISLNNVKQSEAHIEEEMPDEDVVIDVATNCYMESIIARQISGEGSTNLEQAALHISGAAAARTADKLKCKECIDFLILPDSKGTPINCGFCSHLQRGGLIIPQNIVQQCFIVLDATVKNILKNNEANNETFLSFRNAENQVDYLISSAIRQITIPEGKYFKVN